MSSSAPELNACGCCAGVDVETPAEIGNRPGLSAIRYRAGTHSQFRRSMLARLSTSPEQALAGLTTRDSGDFAIALLDAWACVADVLTFYQERIANESCLRTATERYSILQLARLIGYELRPGVAASTVLAFTIDDTPGAPGRATIEAGAKVSSVPAQEQKPQTFETTEPIEARAEWNAMRPRLTERHPINTHAETLYFAGFTTQLKAGDCLLITPPSGSPLPRLVSKVAAEPKLDRTKVTLQPPPAGASPASGSATAKSLGKVGKATAIILDSKATSVGEVKLLAALNDASEQQIYRNIRSALAPPSTVLAFRTKAAIFGHNAPRLETLPLSQREGEGATLPDPADATKGKFAVFPGVYKGRKDSWAETTLDKFHPQNNDRPASAIFLDASYPSIVPRSAIVLKTGGTLRAYAVDAAIDLTKADFALTAKSTRLTLDSANDFNLFAIRTTSVFGAGEELPLARLPIEEAVSENQIDLDALIEGLQPGQRLVVCGELEDFRGNSACEAVVIASVDQFFEEGFTRVKLAKALANSYVRETVTICGNVARATHGETTHEVLGSGDASAANQRFILRQPPLTYVSSAAPSGADSTLQLRVDDVLWHEAPTLHGRGSREHVFVTRIEDDGKTTVQFGDGRTGARLFTGVENVRAVYRKGLGAEGLLDAGQLTTLLTRPLGVRGVSNPLPAAGAQDRESLADARGNAPLTVLTLDRIVSLQDYDDFTRAFSGIAKALATWTWHGETRGVFLTVAAAKGGLVEEGSPLYENLLGAIRGSGDPHVPLRVASYRKAFFRLAGTIRVDPDFEAEKVLAAVRENLHAAFSFESRAFGAPVTLSGIVALIHAVAGVVAVDVDTLARTDGVGGDGTINPLPAALPQPGAASGVRAAELLLLDASSLPELRAAS